MRDVKLHQHSTQVADFVTACGLSIKNVRPPRFALNVGEWQPSQDLVKDLREASTDFFSTAEVYTDVHSSTVVILWALSFDVGSEQGTMLCYSPSGRLRFLHSTNWALPVGPGSKEWIFDQRRDFNHDGKLIHKEEHFLNKKGTVVPKPKLDPDEEKNYDWVFAGTKLSDLKLPATLLK
jgi:hypothetical protein